MDNYPRILVVDDDQNIVESTKAILEEEGYIVDFANNGRDAIKKTIDNGYDLVLLDIRLPDIEGVELLNLVRDTYPRIRKIMITGFPSLKNAISSINKKADAYLIKPINPEQLLSVIRNQLKEQSEERQFSEQKVSEFIETRVRQTQKTVTVRNKNSHKS